MSTPVQPSRQAPAFSVVMPAYGRQSFLNEAIESVLRQTLSDWELIVVDDASPEPLRVPADPRIQLIRQPTNGGFAAGMNAGLDQAKGLYVAVLADDDAWAPSRLANSLRGHAEADVVCCLTADLGEIPRTTETAVVRPMTDEELSSQELPHSMCAMSVRRDLFPLMDPSYRAAEDLEWVIRLSSTKPRWALVESEDFLWRRHDGPRHRNGVEARIEGSERLLVEHANYYVERPRTRAFRLYRIGLMNLIIGNRRTALKYAAKSLFARPNLHCLSLLAKTVSKRQA